MKRPILFILAATISCGGTDQGHKDAAQNGGWDGGGPDGRGLGSGGAFASGGIGGVADGGGSAGTGGSSVGATGGNQGTGGPVTTGGNTAIGGASATGGMNATGGATARGGATSSGGVGGTAAGGNTATGGQTATGGATATGGKTASGGSTAAGGGGGTSTGGITSTGGSTGAGGATSSGGSTGSGGTSTMGGATGAGGATSSGGSTGSGGSSATGGTTGAGGATSSGGSTGSGGASAMGGATGAGGATSSGGSTGTGGSTSLSWEFASDVEGWVCDFADYPPNIGTGYDLQCGWSALPTEVGPGGGLRMSSNNHSDDMFMYLTRKITGLAPQTQYLLDVVAVIDTNAPADCGGIGGSPGESVSVKIGAVDHQPTTAIDSLGWLWFTNLDKGNQSNGGADMKVVGNLGNSRTCPDQTYEPKTYTLSGFSVTSASDGTLWLILGTDSGFEGITTIYYDRISVTLRRGN